MIICESVVNSVLNFEQFLPIVELMKTGTHDILGISNIVVMTEEEEKIRGELETEIEKDIEQEIIDGIRQLALRLHKLYQCRRRRTHPSSLAGCISLQSELNDSLVTKVNIAITREGEFKLAAYESNSKGLNAARHCSPRSDAARRRLGHRIERLHCSKMSGLKSGSFMGTVRRCQVLSPILKNKKHPTAKPERKSKIPPCAPVLKLWYGNTREAMYTQQ